MLSAVVLVGCREYVGDCVGCSGLSWVPRGRVVVSDVPRSGLSDAARVWAASASRSSLGCSWVRGAAACSTGCRQGSSRVVGVRCPLPTWARQKLFPSGFSRTHVDSGTCSDRLTTNHKEPYGEMSPAVIVACGQPEFLKRRGKAYLNAH